MAQKTDERFKALSFSDYRKLAQDDSLSAYEKVGFPVTYRKDKEEKIFQDITRKLTNLSLTNKCVLEIGPGCSGPARMMIELGRKQGHTLILADSPEMLAHLPDEPFIVRAEGCFPRDCAWLLEKYRGKVDAILAYSLLHVVWVDGNPYDFVDAALGLLSDGGEFLLGDIPNISKRRRFFASQGGIRFHQQFTGTQEVPPAEFNRPAPGQIDDAFISSLILRCRAAGFDAYWLPQAAELPMANRREDILIRKP